MALTAARPGVRSSTFDPLLIDNFNRPDGSLGTAYNGQTWTGTSGNAVISSGRFTCGTANAAALSFVPTTGTIGSLSVSMDCDPGPSALGDQSYMIVEFFKDPSTQEMFLLEISQRNWFFIYFSPTGTQTIINSGSPGYTYSTPFRLYITANYAGGSTYFDLETSNLTGGAHTVLCTGSYAATVTNGSRFGIQCWNTQYFDNLRNLTQFTPTTVTIPFSDNFNRANGSPGTPWYPPVNSPGLQIFSNTLQYTGVSSAVGLRIPSQSFDVTFTAHYSASTGARDDLQMGFFRSDYLYGEPTFYLWATNPDVGSGGSSGIALYKNTSGSFSLITNTTGYLFENNTYTMRIVVSGTSFTAYVNGVSQLTATLPSIPPANQKSIMFITNKTGSYIDDVSFV